MSKTGGKNWKKVRGISDKPYGDEDQSRWPSLPDVRSLEFETFPCPTSIQTVWIRASVTLSRVQMLGSLSLSDQLLCIQLSHISQQLQLLLLNTTSSMFVVLTLEFETTGRLDTPMLP
jgi:hypothetical protein